MLMNKVTVLIVALLTTTSQALDNRTGVYPEKIFSSPDWEDEDGCMVITPKEPAMRFKDYITRIGPINVKTCFTGTDLQVVVDCEDDRELPDCVQRDVCLYDFDCDYTDHQELCGVDYLDPKASYMRNCLAVRHLAYFGVEEKLHLGVVCDQEIEKTEAQELPSVEVCERRSRARALKQEQAHEQEHLLRGGRPPHGKVGFSFMHNNSTMQPPLPEGDNMETIDARELQSGDIVTPCNNGYSRYSLYFAWLNSFVTSSNGNGFRIHIHNIQDHTDNHSPASFLASSSGYQPANRIRVKDTAKGKFRTSYLYVCSEEVAGNGNININFGGSSWSGAVEYADNKFRPEPDLDLVQCSHLEVSPQVWRVNCATTQNAGMRVKHPPRDVFSGSRSTTAMTAWTPN